MKPKPKLSFVIFLLVDAVLFALCLVQIVHPIFDFGNFGMFNAKGVIAQEQARLIVTAILLMLVIVIPVLTAGFFIAFKYRAGREQKYEPDWDNRHKYLQIVWWAFPILIITLISIINFKSARQLDPFRPINSSIKPLTIQVVALQWKWLFIYPDQNIATINYIKVPVNTPLHFELTADGPMSLFWVPQLGSEMSAMAGMETQLNLETTDVGQFPGQNSEINGAGYSGMKFMVDSVSADDFNGWVKSTKSSGQTLDQATYDNLAKPTQNNPEATFSSVDDTLYNGIMMKYMVPASTSTIMNMHE